MELGLHTWGRFDRRLPIDNAIWPHHDILWVHDGAVALNFHDLGAREQITGPGGVLVLPGTRFSGAALGGFATSSVCHFTLTERETTHALAGPGYLLPWPDERSYLQAQVRLAMHLHRQQPGETARRRRLIAALIDGFAPPQSIAQRHEAGDRLDLAWEAAAKSLHRIRTLADVAERIGLSESALRAQHRARHGTSAGAHLRALRLARAEELLAATGFTLGEIAAQVGYGHAETLSAAYRKARGMAPGAWRRQSNPFA